MSLAEMLRGQAELYHGYADEVLTTCIHQPVCGDAQAAAEGYRVIAYDLAQRAIEVDLAEGTVRL